MTRHTSLGKKRNQHGADEWMDLLIHVLLTQIGKEHNFLLSTLHFQYSGKEKLTKTMGLKPINNIKLNVKMSPVIGSKSFFFFFMNAHAFDIPS